MNHSIFLTREHSVWCVPHTEHGVSCLLPRATDPIPLDTIDAPALGALGLVPLCDEPPAPGAEAIGLRALFDRASPVMYGAAVRAVPVAEWRRTTRFCGACGAVMVRDTTERAMVCPACQHRVYPRINPVAIVCVTRGDEVLLARRLANPTGFFSVIAGFVEAGESLAETVAREVQEEVGVTVKNIRYFDSQPWSFSNNLMIGFTAEYAGGEVRPDGVEMGEAGWFRRDALPSIPGPISIARRMIDAWERTRG